MLLFPWVSLMTQRVKHLPAIQETWVRSLGWEDPLEKEMEPTPVFLPGESHGWRSLVGYSPLGRKELDTTEQLHFHFSFTFYSLMDLLQNKQSERISIYAAWEIHLLYKHHVCVHTHTHTLVFCHLIETTSCLSLGVCSCSV